MIQGRRLAKATCCICIVAVVLGLSVQRAEAVVVTGINPVNFGGVVQLTLSSGPIVLPPQGPFTLPASESFTILTSTTQGEEERGLPLTPAQMVAQATQIADFVNANSVGGYTAMVFGATIEFSHPDGMAGIAIDVLQPPPGVIQPPPGVFPQFFEPKIPQVLNFVRLGGIDDPRFDFTMNSALPAQGLDLLGNASFMSLSFGDNTGLLGQVTHQFNPGESGASVISTLFADLQGDGLNIALTGQTSFAVTIETPGAFMQFSDTDAALRPGAFSMNLPIPESSTYLLFAVCILGMVVIGYRQRKKAAQGVTMTTND